MYILTNNRMLLLGPVAYSKKRFESVLKDDLEITVDLPAAITAPYHDEENEFSIYPVTNTSNEEFNPRIEFLNGPYWTYTEAGAESEYRATLLPLEAAKSMLKAIVAEKRYAKEIAGVDVVVNGQTVRAYTSREDRGVYLEAVQLAQDDVTQYDFKFMGGVFLSVNRLDLHVIIAAVAAHIQSVFAWESTLGKEIDACTTHAELALLEVDPDA